MATFASIEAFERELAQVERRMEQEYRTWGEKVAKAARPEAYRAAAADLGGDPKFSGWPGDWLRLDVKPKRWGAALIPASRLAAGMWTVAEVGRNQGDAQGFQGPGVNRRTGLTARTKSGNLRKVRAVQSRRWNGYTQGKGTASDAQARFESLAERIPDQELKKLLRRSFDVS